MVKINKVKSMIVYLLAFSMLIFAIGIVWMYSDFNKTEMLSTVEENKILNFSNGKKIYVRARAWGVTGNHEEIVFSEAPINIPNKKKDYIFYTDEVLYKIEKNILTIYAPESGKNIPNKQFHDIKIIFKGLKNADEITDYGLNYKNYKLQKISCCSNQ